MLEKEFGIEIDLSVVREGGNFDQGPYIPLKKSCGFVMTDDLYCKIYVDAPLEKEAMKQLIMEISGGTSIARSITTDVFEIAVFKSRLGALSGGADFLYWPYYLEVEAVNDVTGEEVFVAALASLIRGLKARGFGAVPSCSFEDQLLPLVGS